MAVMQNGFPRQHVALAVAAAVALVCEVRLWIIQLRRTRKDRPRKPQDQRSPSRRT
jgi:hypothetical protein